jgi:hypothetical protein
MPHRAVANRNMPVHTLRHTRQIMRTTMPDPHVLCKPDCKPHCTRL